MAAGRAKMPGDLGLFPVVSADLWRKRDEKSDEKRSLERRREIDR